ncbi:hypothetical protein EB118_06090 [bacterium]|nr:hypothetical protein [bacterium]NDC93782.1 hypothetical protein [bacterium]NDD83115.1 hypothetical protein [bacterium]NDG29648.1 hypothetical protein [bacterium]
MSLNNYVIIQAGEYKGYNAFVVDTTPEMYVIKDDTSKCVYVPIKQCSRKGARIKCVRGPHKGLEGRYVQTILEKALLKVDTSGSILISICLKDIVYHSQNQYQDQCQDQCQDEVEAEDFVFATDTLTKCATAQDHEDAAQDHEDAAQDHEGAAKDDEHAELTVSYSDTLRTLLKPELSKEDQYIISQLKKILSDSYGCVLDSKTVIEQVKQHTAERNIQIKTQDFKYVLVCVLYNCLKLSRYFDISFDVFLKKLSSNRSEFGRYFVSPKLNMLLDSVFLQGELDDETSQRIESGVREKDPLKVLQLVASRAYKCIYGDDTKEQKTTFQMLALTPKAPFVGHMSGIRSADVLRKELSYANSELQKTTLSESFQKRLQASRENIKNKLITLDAQLLQYRYSLKLRRMATTLSRTDAAIARAIASDISKGVYILDDAPPETVQILNKYKKDLNTIWESYDTCKFSDPIDEISILSNLNRQAAKGRVPLIQRRQFLEHRKDIIGKLTQKMNITLDWNCYIHICNVKLECDNV